MSKQYLNRFVKKELEFSLIDISTEEAMFLVNWTKTYENNRLDVYKINELKIKTFKEKILKNKMILFHLSNRKNSFVREPIIIDDNGCIYEGRHRMMAMSEMNEKKLSIKFFFILGFSKKYKELWNQYRFGKNINEIKD